MPAFLILSQNCNDKQFYIAGNSKPTIGTGIFRQITAICRHRECPIDLPYLKFVTIGYGFLPEPATESYEETAGSDSRGA
jgi:hypothetical protein